MMPNSKMSQLEKLHLGAFLMTQTATESAALALDF